MERLEALLESVGLVTPEMLETHLAISRGSPAILVDIDSEDAPILFVSPLVNEMFGYMDRELCGQSVHVLVPEAFRDVHREKHVPEYAASPKPRSMGARGMLKLQGQHRRGTTFDVAVTLAPGGLVRGKRTVVATIGDLSTRMAGEPSQ